MEMNQRISILGAALSTINREALLTQLGNSIMENRKILVLSGNVYAYNLAYENRWLRDLFNQADFVRLDGSGVRWAARILGHQMPERMTWADFAWHLGAFAEKNKFSLFFLGGRPGIADQAADRLKERFPDLIIAGTQHGYFDKNPGSEEARTVIEQINQVKPKILVIGFGMPVQERWLVENRLQIDANVILTGGAVFDYISGELRRAPKWMTDNGLEWLGRMLIEPRRLWKRYLLGNPLFLWRVLLQRFGVLRYD